MRSVQLVFALALGFSVACGGDDGGGDDGDNAADAAPTVDAVAADAAPVGGFGQTCSPADQDCVGDDFICLNVAGATNPWCTKQCTTPSASETPDCAPHDGPGVARCLLSVSMEGGGESINVCAIVCADTSGTYCPAGECDDTCPGDMQCVVATGEGAPEGLKICE